MMVFDLSMVRGVRLAAIFGVLLCACRSVGVPESTSDMPISHSEGGLEYPCGDMQCVVGQLCLQPRFLIDYCVGEADACDPGYDKFLGRPSCRPGFATCVPRDESQPRPRCEALSAACAREPTCGCLTGYCLARIDGCPTSEASLPVLIYCDGVR